MMTAEQRAAPRQRMKSAPRVQLLPVTDDQLERIDGLIETLIAIRDALDGDQDLEIEHHDGAAEFPGDALCDQPQLAAHEAGPGDDGDAEEAEADEDSDADEWSGVVVYDQNGRWRWV